MSAISPESRHRSFDARCSRLETTKATAGCVSCCGLNCHTLNDMLLQSFDDKGDCMRALESWFAVSTSMLAIASIGSANV
jgi:hypothetical protein